MNKTALLREIINANNAQQHLARELNRLAGKVVFHVLSDAEMLAFVTGALNGAASISTIADFERLRLPPLDRELIAEVKDTSVTSLMLLGEIHYIDYANPSEPTVSLSLGSESAHLVGDLDDRGIFLPDGRQITLQVRIGLKSEHRCKDIPTLKAMLRDYILDRVWKSWTRPALPTLNYLDADAAVPEVAVVQWGNCPVTREPLHAYGTVRGVGFKFEAEWSRDRDVAEHARLTAVACLESMRSHQADCATRRRKKQEHAEQAGLLREQLVALEGDMAMLPKGDKTLARVKEHLELFAQIDPTKASAVSKWSEQARAIITSGNRALVRVPDVLRAVIELLFEALTKAPPGQCQDDALERLGELSALISPTLNATSGAQKLMATRVAIGQAFIPNASCGERTLQLQAA